MNEYRAPRTWHIEQRFGRHYVVNQFGGFSGYHSTLDAAEAQLAGFITDYGDTAERI